MLDDVLRVGSGLSLKEVSDVTRPTNVDRCTVYDYFLATLARLSGSELQPLACVPGGVPVRHRDRPNAQYGNFYDL